MGAEEKRKSEAITSTRQKTLEKDAKLQK